MAQAKLPKIVQDIKDCLHDVKKEYQEGQVPITDDSVPLHKLCAKLEYMLQMDMKARNSVWRGRLDYWDYIYHCLAKIKGLNDGVRFVRAMSEIKSSLGRGRAFIRYSLVHHRLGDSLQQCFSNMKVTSEWYKPNSVLTNPSYYSAFFNELYDLNDIQFDLAPTGHDLDTAWPTFARKTLPGVNSLHLWMPPSRSSSISSLSSQPSTTDGLSSPQSESALFGMEEQYQKLQKDFEECEMLNRQLRKKIDQLEKDNEEMHKLALETEDRMGAAQNDLLRRNQDLEYQVDKVTRELRSKEEQLTEFEDAKERTKEAEKLNTDLYARIDVLNTQHESREKLLLESERTLQERLQATERELSDLKLQEHSLQGELEARRLSEERRVNQVQELEAKITCLEGKNVELLARMEGMVQDKDEKVSSHFESANKVHELLAKLEGVEHQNIALKGANEGLNRKVQELEDSKTKSNTEAEILRGSLEERTKELSHTSQQKYEKVGVLENENKTLRTKNNDLTIRVEELGRTLQEMEIKKQKCEHKSNQLQIDVENLVAKEGKHKQEHTELKAKFDGLERQKQELEEQVQCFENSNQKMMEEHRELQGQINEKEKEISDLKEKLSQTSVKKGEFAQSLEALTKNVSELESERDMTKQGFDRLLSALTDILESSKVDQESNLQCAPFKELQSIDNSIIFDSQKTLDKVKAVIDDRSSAIQKLSETEKSVENMQYEIKTTKQQLQEEQEDHGKTKRELESAVMQIRNFESDIKTVTSDFDSHKQAAEKVQIEVTQLQKSRNDQETTIDSIKSQLQASENKSKEIENEKETILIELAAVKESNAKLSEVKTHLEAENQQLVKAKNVLQVHLDKEKQAKKGLEVAVEDLRRTQEENVSMEQVMEERKHKMVQEHEDRVEFLTQQFNMVKEDLEKANQEKKKFEEEHKSMSEEHATMKEKLEMAVQEKNETKEINQALNAEIASVNERIETAQDERNEIAHKLEQISEETATQLTEKASMITELEEQLIQTNKVKAELESKVNEIQEELQKKTTSFSELEERSKEVEEQLGSMQGVMEQEMSALKFKLSSEAMQYQEKLQSYKTLENELEQLREKCREQDHLIESQQVDVADLTTQLKTLQNNSAKQMSEAQNKNIAKEKDFKLLQDSLAEMTKMLEEQKVSNMNLEEELSSLKADKQGVESHLQQQLTLAENDNVELKKNLIKLVKEKDTLWQWTDKLVHQQKMKASERWLEDKEVNKCMQCETDFGLMVRRHHCRLCGRIFCSKCCNSYILAAQSKNKVRVCEQCFVLHHHSRESDSINTSLLNQDGEAEEDIEDALLTSRLRLSSRTSVYSEVSGVEASGAEASGEEANESKIGPLIGPGDLEPTMLDDSTPGAKFIIGSASSTPTPPPSPTLTGSTGGNSIAVIDSPTEGTQPQMNREEVNPVIVLDTPLPGAHNIIAKEEDSKGSSEPDFDIISEEEVQSVKEEDLPGFAKDTRSLPMEKSVVSAVITTKELEAGFGCDAEILVKAGHSHSIPIHLDEPGLTLCWEFASAPKTIAFSVTYRETETSDLFDELIPLCKCNSHRHAVQGELMSRKAGVYTLVFDNQFSRFTSKTVKYSLQIKRPEAAY